MMVMTTVPLAEAKAKLSQYADEVDRTHDRVHITRNGHSYVVLVSEDDLASLEETVELLSDAAAQARLRESEQAIEAGDVYSVDDVHALLAARQHS